VNIPMYRRMILLIAIIMVRASIVFAQTEGEYKTPSLSKNETLWNMHPYHVGMSREELYKIFPQDSQQNYFKQGNEEWIVFDDILTTDDLKDIIAFYLKDGKVLGWDKKSLPKTPEERLKMIEERHGHGIGASDSGGATNDLDYKIESRRRRIERDL
jgi:hypothetical protein